MLGRGVTTGTRLSQKNPQAGSPRFRSGPPTSSKPPPPNQGPGGQRVRQLQARVSWEVPADARGLRGLPLGERHIDTNGLGGALGR